MYYCFTKIDFRARGAKINFANRPGPAFLPKLIFAPRGRENQFCETDRPGTGPVEPTASQERRQSADGPAPANY